MARIMSLPRKISNWILDTCNKKNFRKLMKLNRLTTVQSKADYFIKSLNVAIIGRAVSRMYR